MDNTAASIEELDQLNFLADFNPKKTSKRSILLVEDDDDQRILFKMMLENSGYTVHTANSAKNALFLLRHTPVQLIITDIMMPEIDGIEFLKKVKKLPNYNSVPTIALTASRVDVENKVCTKYGPDMLCMKNTAIKTLKKQIEFLLS
ncbi:MAG: response regulator [Bdellovibrionota bacterium]